MVSLYKLIINIYNFINNNKKSTEHISTTMLQPSDTVRSAFKQCISKLTQIDTRTQAFKQIQGLITQNKTTTSLRIWLSVLSENRKRHVESEIYVVDFIVKVYGKNLLDPIDKIPSLQKSVFRITEILCKFFGEQTQNVLVACQKTWLDIYEITLKDEPLEIKKKLLYDNLEAIINGGGGKIAQTTAQYIVEGLLQRSLSTQDLQFFKQIAKRVLVLFLKTTVIHPSTLISLQTILTFFNINNLIPLLQQIVAKILSYIPLAQANSVGYRIKGQICNCLAVIGDQIDRNGLEVWEKISKVLADMATDKVWAVQAPGRKALQIWNAKKKQWDQKFQAKNQRVPQINNMPIQQSYQLSNLKQNVSQYPKTADNWTRNRPQFEENRFMQAPKNQTAYEKGWNKPQPDLRVQPQISQQLPQFPNKKSPSQQQQNFLQKNTGPGGGNNYLSAEQYQERHRSQITHQRKMQQIKKSIYGSKSEIQFEDTVVLDEKKPKGRNQGFDPRVNQVQQSQQQQQEEEDDFLGQWEKVLALAQKNKFQQSIKTLLQMDDDLYFLRFFLKYSSAILQNVTRPTSNKVLQKMLSIKKTNFMEQMLFKMVAETARLGIGKMLTNSQNLQIVNNLDNASKIGNLKQIADKVKYKYESSLDQ